MSENLKVAIIGAGLGGLAVAIAPRIVETLKDAGSPTRMVNLQKKQLSLKIGFIITNYANSFGLKY
jgi:thioredoxin reductase